MCIYTYVFFYPLPCYTTYLSLKFHIIIILCFLIYKLEIAEKLFYTSINLMLFIEKKNINQQNVILSHFYALRISFLFEFWIYSHLLHICCVTPVWYKNRIELPSLFPDCCIEHTHNSAYAFICVKAKGILCSFSLYPGG